MLCCILGTLGRFLGQYIRVELSYLNKSTPPYTLLVFLEGVIVNITPPWIRAPLGRRPSISFFLTRVSLFRFKQKDAKLSKKDRKTNSKQARGSETKQNKV
jgi:hypothetical protein